MSEVKKTGLIILIDVREESEQLIKQESAGEWRFQLSHRSNAINNLAMSRAICVSSFLVYHKKRIVMNQKSQACPNLVGRNEQSYFRRI